MQQLNDTDGWDRTRTPYRKLEFGKWQLDLPANADGSCPIKHLSEVKIIVQSQSGELLERLSPWATYVTQNQAEGVTYKQRLWHPENVSFNVLSCVYRYV